MNRKQLEELGLEKDAIDTIMDLNGQAINDTKKELEEANTTAQTLQAELDKREADFKTLKEKADNAEELEEQLNTLTSEYDTYKEDTSKREQEIKVNSALKLALAKSGTIDEVALKAHLDLEEVELNEDGTVKGIDDQLSTLKEEKAYLFGEKRNSGFPHGKPPAKKTNEEAVKEAMGFK